jgi:hypothetical protein
MRKRIIETAREQIVRTDREWLNLEALARIELTSEDPAHPVEYALSGKSEVGWQAAGPGPQTIRLLFDEPQKVGHISLLFREEERERTQEFALRCASSGTPEYREIVRQQYNFSPSGMTTEHENYDFDLDGVTAVELIIVPDISGGSARASLARLSIAS